MQLEVHNENGRFGRCVPLHAECTPPFPLRVHSASSASTNGSTRPRRASLCDDVSYIPPKQPESPPRPASHHPSFPKQATIHTIDVDDEEYDDDSMSPVPSLPMLNGNSMSNVPPPSPTSKIAPFGPVLFLPGVHPRAVLEVVSSVGLGSQVFNWGGGVKRASQNWGEGFGNRAQLTGPSMSHCEIWR